MINITRSTPSAPIWNPKLPPDMQLWALIFHSVKNAGAPQFPPVLQAIEALEEIALHVAGFDAEAASWLQPFAVWRVELLTMQTFSAASSNI